jgi:hypothetical protein
MDLPVVSRYVIVHSHFHQCTTISTADVSVGVIHACYIIGKDTQREAEYYGQAPTAGGPIYVVNDIPTGNAGHANQGLRPTDHPFDAPAQEQQFSSHSQPENERDHRLTSEKIV